AGAVRLIDANFETESLTPGDLIEVSGEVFRNPLAELLALFDRLYPMFKVQQAGLPGTAVARRGKQPPTQSSPPSSQEMGIQVMQWISEDLSKSNSQDVLLRLARSQPIILTLNRDFGTGAVIDDLLGSTLTVLAKVSDVVPDGQTVNLVRRSVL